VTAGASKVGSGKGVATSTSETGTFGALLRQHRLAASLSQEMLGERAQLSVNAIAALERGRRTAPRPGTVVVLAEALGLTPQERAALIDAATLASKAKGVQPEAVVVAPWIRHNLPPPLTSFVGRRQDLVDVRQSLSDTRLVTLTGPGGVGKTRLALEVALQLARSGTVPYAAGIWRVELAPLADGGLIPRVVASALGVEEVPGQPVLQTMLAWLHARQVLLVLDNCEHLVAACGSVTSALLEACPGLTILATSREALNVAGEVVWPVGPLEADSEGLQMFVDRAALASAQFRVSSDTRSAVIRICQRLDGLPLAIELAAARVNALSVEEIEQRLDQRFTLLTAGRRSSPPRHQTLRALVDWSYELLTTEEQALFQQLSVFSGGWTLEAAEAVCQPAAEVMALLLSLVNKSLLQVEQHGGQSRYRLLETLRQYAMDKLRDARAEGPARTRHLRWCERLARAGDRGMSGPHSREWLRRLEAEVDNFRAALRWSLLETAELETGLRLAASLVRGWFLDGTASEGSEWLEALLVRAPPSAARVEALSASGFLLLRRGNPRAAHPLLEEAVALARHLGDSCLLAVALDHLGELRVQEGDLAEARSALQESLALTPEEASGPVFWPVYFVLSNLGELAEVEGDQNTAAAYYERSLDLARAHHDGFRAVPLRRLGQLAIDRGDRALAHELFAESVVAACERGKAAWGVSPALSHLANLAMAAGQPDRALRLAGAANGLREEHQAQLLPTDAARLETWIGSARSALGEAAAARAWAEGHAMTLDRAMAYALERRSVDAQTTSDEAIDETLATARPADTHPMAVNDGATALLSPREREVAALVAQGRSNREIGAALTITARTADTHVGHILTKLDVHTRAQIAAWVVEHGAAITRSS
jgi:non-specific serine/threonine protein kinase